MPDRLRRRGVHVEDIVVRGRTRGPIPVNQSRHATLPIYMGARGASRTLVSAVSVGGIDSEEELACRSSGCEGLRCGSWSRATFRSPSVSTMTRLSPTHAQPSVTMGLRAVEPQGERRSRLPRRVPGRQGGRRHGAAQRVGRLRSARAGRHHDRSQGQRPPQTWERHRPVVLKFGGLPGSREGSKVKRSWSAAAGRIVDAFVADVYAFCVQTTTGDGPYDGLDIGRGASTCSPGVVVAGTGQKSIVLDRDPARWGTHRMA